jgi:hypothetical protein
MDTLVELNIREHPAGDCDRAQAGFSQPVLDKLNPDLFEQQFERWRPGRLCRNLRQPAGNLLQGRAVVHRHGVLDLPRFLIAHEFTQDVDIGRLAQARPGR